MHLLRALSQPIQIDPAKKGAVIGPGGRIINQIKEQSTATVIDIDEDGNVEVRVQCF
jgi:polyribonucleotide nucleotidyltransferase